MRYRFGAYVLDTQRYELRRAGGLVPLRPKVFQVLAYLLAQRDRMVAKQELMEQVWPGQFLSDETLSTCITEVRQAIGDSGQRQGLIQTRRGVGYRFVAAVTVHDEHAAAAIIPPPLPLPETPPAPPDPPASILAGEHKPVTVLVGTVHLAAALEAETLHQARQTVFTAVLEVGQRYGGTVYQLLDAGFVVLFGAPLAQEDHAHRAVLAALDLRQHWHRQGAEAGQGADVALPLSLGLHTGSVIVDRLGTEPRFTYTAVGDTTVVATGLARQAAPGTIWLSDATRRLVDGYVHLESGPPVTVPGHTGPVPAYAVLGRGPRRSPLAMQGTQPLSPFVGRERELATLQALLAQVAAGTGQVVGIVGEPGMGKSRLVYELRQSLRDNRVAYLDGRCVSYGRETPYLLMRDLLQQGCGIATSDTPAVSAAKVHQRLQEAGLAPEEAAPYLLHLLDMAESPSRLTDLDPQGIRERIFTTLQQFHLASSQQRPLVIEVEDLHWIDPTSEAYLVELIAHLAGVPLLLVLTFRPGYRPAWMDKSYATQLTVPPLSAADSRRVVQAVCQGVPVAASLVQAMVAKAAGNPFFLEELAWAVKEHRDGSLPPQVPATVSAVLAARIDRLPAAHKQLLQMAAVIGQEVPLSLLQAVVAPGDEVLRQGMRALQAAEFLIETRLVPEPVYTFKHALLQDAAYQSLLQRTRQRAHAQLAQVLVAQFPAMVETQPERLAHHYTAAGLAAQAVEYWQRAGERSNARSAYVEAVAHLTQGLEGLRTLPDTPARARHELDMQLTLGQALRFTRGFSAPEVGHTYTRARELCQQVGDTPRLIAVLGGLANFYGVRGEIQTQREIGEQLRTLGQRQHNPEILARAYLELGIVWFRLGEFVSARAHLEQALAGSAAPQDPSLTSPFGVDSRLIACGHMVWVLWLLGYPGQALTRSHEMLTYAREVRHAFSLARALYNATILHRLLGEVDAAQEYAEAALAIITEGGFWTNFARHIIFTRGWALAAQGQHEAGIAQMRQALAAQQPLGAAPGTMMCRVLLGEAYGRIGQAHEGLLLLAEALAVVDQGNLHDEAELHRIKGELLVQAGTRPRAQGTRHKWEEAEVCFQQALAVARRQQAKSWELRAAVSLSRLWQQQGKRDAARALLVGVYHWFTEGFDTPDLQDARTLLEML